MHNLWPSREGNRGPHRGRCRLLQKVPVFSSVMFTRQQTGAPTHCASCLCSPCSQTDRLFALSRLRQSGAFLTTTEAVLLQLVQDAKHPKFREVGLFNGFYFLNRNPHHLLYSLNMQEKPTQDSCLCVDLYFCLLTDTKADGPTFSRYWPACVLQLPVENPTSLKTLFIT